MLVVFGEWCLDLAVISVTKLEVLCSGRHALREWSCKLWYCFHVQKVTKSELLRRGD